MLQESREQKAEREHLAHNALHWDALSTSCVGRLLSCVCYACLASCQHFLPQLLMNSEPWRLQWGHRSCSTPITPHDLKMSVSFYNKPIARISKILGLKKIRLQIKILPQNTGPCGHYRISFLHGVVCYQQWWSVTKYNYFVTVLKYIFQVSVLYWSSFILSNFYFYFTTFQSIRSYFLLHYIS